MALQLLRRTTCPHCWTAFAPEEALWISAHSDLLGDPRLGPDQLQRFLPTRFNIDGNAIDAKGLVSHSLACPRCHLGIPRAVLEMETFFVSILGNSGLRQVLLFNSTHLGAETNPAGAFRSFP